MYKQNIVNLSEPRSLRQRALESITKTRDMLDSIQQKSSESAVSQPQPVVEISKTTPLPTRPKIKTKKQIDVC